MSALSSPEDIAGLLSSSPAAPSSDLLRSAERYPDAEEHREEIKEKWEDMLDEDPVHEDSPISELTEYIRKAFRDAEQARSANGIDCKILTGRRLMKREYTPQEKAMMPEVDVFYGLVESISNIALAFLRSILAPDVDNQLWELEHSPIPELPEFIAERAAQLAAFQVQAEAITPQPDPETGELVPPPPMTEDRAVEIAEEMRAKIFESIDNQAAQHVQNLKKALQDSLEIADFYKVFDEFLQWLVVDPVACIKGPVVASKKIPEWKDGKKIYPKRKYQHYEAVDVVGLFPSPDSVDAQTGSFIIHLHQMTRHDLQCAKRMKGFVAKNIDDLLLEYNEKCREWLNNIESAADDLNYMVGEWRDYEGIDVIEYHGRIPGYVLTRSEITSLDGEKVDPTETYEMEVWVTGNKIIRAVAACNESGRPFHCASLYPCKGSFWGESIPHRAEDEQRAANAALRAAIRDMGYSSGPIVQMDVSMLDESQKIPNRMHAGMVVKTNSRKRGTGGNVMSIEQLSTQAPQFLALLNTFFQNAELITGINRQMMGQAQPGISTLGEANILQGNATTGLRSMLVPIDCVLEDLIEMTACQIMRTTDDPMLKADARVKAKGSTHLLERELNKGNLLQLLNTLYPVMQTQPGAFEPFALGCLVREIAISFGQDPDKFVPDPIKVEQRNLELLLSQPQLAQGGGGGIAGGVSQAPATPAVGTAEPSIAPPGV